MSESNTKTASISRCKDRIRREAAQFIFTKGDHHYDKFFDYLVEETDCRSRLPDYFVFLCYFWLNPEDVKYKVGLDLWVLMGWALRYGVLYEVHLERVIQTLNDLNPALPHLECINEINEMYEEYKKCRDCGCIGRTESVIDEEDCKICYDFYYGEDESTYMKIFEFK